MSPKLLYQAAQIALPNHAVLWFEPLFKSPLDLQRQFPVQQNVELCSTVPQVTRIGPLPSENSADPRTALRRTRRGLRRDPHRGSWEPPERQISSESLAEVVPLGWWPSGTLELCWDSSTSLKVRVICDSRFESQIAQRGHMWGVPAWSGLPGSESPIPLSGGKPPPSLAGSSSSMSPKIEREGKGSPGLRGIILNCRFDGPKLFESCPEVPEASFLGVHFLRHECETSTGVLTDFSRELANFKRELAKLNRKLAELKRKLVVLKPILPGFDQLYPGINLQF